MSARTGTAYAGIRTDATTYLRGATALAEGMSIRATGRLLSVDKDPVNHWLPVLGAHCQNVMSGLDHGIGHFASMSPEENLRLNPHQVETRRRPHHP